MFSTFSILIRDEPADNFKFISMGVANPLAKVMGNSDFAEVN